MIDTLFEIGVHNAGIATLLAACIWLVTRWVKSAPVAHVLWLAVLVRLIVPPLVTVPIVSAGLGEEVRAVIAAPFRGYGAELSPVEIGDDPDQVSRLSSDGKAVIQSYLVSSWEEWIRSNLQNIVYTIWILGVLFFGSLASCRVLRFRRILRRAEEAEEGLLNEVKQIAARIGLKRIPSIRITRARLSPLVFGINRPTLLLPLSLLEELSEPARRTLIAHELAHVQRRDTWRVWFELAVVTLYWWHPVAWLARVQIRQTADRCCDGWVLRWYPSDGNSYLEGMLKTLDFLAPPTLPLPEVACGAGEFRSLNQRISMVVSCRADARLSLRQLFLLSIPLLFSLVVYPVFVRAEKADFQAGLTAKLRAIEDSSEKPEWTEMEASSQIRVSLNSESELIRVQLTDGFDPDWLKNLAEMGVVESVTLQTREAISASHFSELKHAHVIRLNIEGPYTDAHIHELEQHLQIETLSLRGTLISDASVAALGTLPNLRNLTIEEANISDEGLQRLACLTRLSSLNLYQCNQITDAGADALLQLPNLQNLSLSCNAMLTRQFIKTVSLLKSLKSLQLDGMQMEPSDCFEISKLTQLVSLSISDTGVDDSGLEYLSRMTSLKTLTMARTGVTDEGVVSLQRLSTLQSLDLCGTSISDRGVKHLTALRKLSDLDLSSTQVTDETISLIRELTRLVHLNLDDTRLTAKCIADLARMTQLERLRVSRTSIPQSAILWLRKKNPELAVHPLSPPAEVEEASDQEFLAGISRFANAESGKADYSIDLSIARLGEEQLSYLKNNGLVGEVRLRGNSTNTATDLKALADIPLTGLTLVGVPYSNDGLAALEGHSSIEHLTLESSVLSESGVRTLLSLPKLTRLNLDDVAITDRELGEIGGLVRLQQLSLSNLADITPNGISHLANIQSLQELSLRACNNLSGTIIPDSLVQLVGLKVLRLHDVSVTASQLSALDHFPSLRILSLVHCGVDDFGVEQLVRSSKLEVLSLDNNAVSDAAVEHLKKLPAIHTLLLASTAITDACMDEIASLPKLRCLNVSSTTVGDQGLSKLCNNQHLWYLNLDETLVTSESIPVFEGLPQLRFLSVAGTAVPEPDVANLTKQYSGVSVQP